MTGYFNTKNIYKNLAGPVADPATGTGQQGIRQTNSMKWSP